MNRYGKVIEADMFSCLLKAFKNANK